MSPADSGTVRFATFDWTGAPARIEYRWLGTQRRERPLVVFLHEGLGSVAMWRDFPPALCDAVSVRGLVFSRPGYGRSAPHSRDDRFDVDYQQVEADELLPAFFTAIGVAEPVWLFGHSDGATIALLYAARFPERVAGLVLLAPHVFVEDVSVASIELARNAYLETDLRERLARHHDDVDCVFWRWNRIWLDPRYRDWNIEHVLNRIGCPLLAIQGLDDEYGTLAQLDAIARGVPQTQRVELADCRHSPHRDQPAAVIAAVGGFIEGADRESVIGLPGRRRAAPVDDPRSPR